MGCSVVAENGTYNWSHVIISVPKGAYPGDITEPKLSQDYLHKIKAYDELFPCQ